MKIECTISFIISIIQIVVFSWHVIISNIPRGHFAAMAALYHRVSIVSCVVSEKDEIDIAMHPIYLIYRINQLNL